MPASRPFARLHRPFRTLLAAALLASAGLASAAAPQQMNQVPGYYRMAVGSYEITALYDGAIDLDSALLKNIGEQEIRALLARKFLKGPAVQTAVNAYLINTGSKLVLVDAGAAKLFPAPPHSVFSGAARNVLTCAVSFRYSLRRALAYSALMLLILFLVS